MPIWPNRRLLSNRSRPLLTKRRKFVAVALVLSLGLLLTQQLTVEQRYWVIAAMAALSYGLTAWALWKEMRGILRLVNMVLPVMYPTAVALFYFLLPQEPLTRSIVVGIFGVTMYALLLTTNIYAVARVRTIQLLRAARAVGFLLTVLTSALLYHVIFSLHVSLLPTVLMVFAVSYPLILHGVWAYSLGEKLQNEGWYSLGGAVVLAELSMATAFWLIDAPLASISLAMGMYVVLGLFQHEAEGRLFGRTIQEYVWFAGIVYVVVTAAVVNRWIH